MKTIFLPIDDPDVCRPMFEVAIAFARRFGSYIEGGATLPVLDNYIVGEMVPLWPPQQRSMGDISREAHEVFSVAMTRAGISTVTREGEVVPTQGWCETPLLGDGAVAERARVFDITVVGRPTANGGPRLSLLETIVFESGRPLLIAPPDAQPQTIGESVCIAWNCSTETARATAHAMPVLAKAKRVQVLTVEGGTVPGPSGAELVRTLRMNGIDAEERTVPARSSRSTGEAMLAEAEAFGADLLIKGAYTQSRLRQMIFGGATAHILAQTKMPVLMAH